MLSRAKARSRVVLPGVGISFARMTSSKPNVQNFRVTAVDIETRIDNTKLTLVCIDHYDGPVAIDIGYIGARK